MTDEKKRRHVMPEYKLREMATLGAADLACLVMLGRITVAGIYSWIYRNYGTTAAAYAVHPQIKQALTLLRKEKKRRRRWDRLQEQMHQLAAQDTFTQGVQ